MMIFEKLLCTMMSQVVLFAYRMNIEYLKKEASYKISTKEVIVILSDLCNEIKKR